MMNEDMELVRAYARRQSEPAFDALVERHLPLVYSAALRQVRDFHLAEEVAQTVFIILAQKAGSLGAGTLLPSWLHRATQFTAANVLRSQRRRARREQEAYMQNWLHREDAGDRDASSPTPEETWDALAPLLDAAIAALSEKDRRAIMLRFFQGQSMEEIGAALGASTAAAKMRVNRATEKLRHYFAQRGVTSTATMLSAVLSANAVHAAPTGLAQTISAVALTKGAAVSTTTLTLIKGTLKLMAWTKAKTVIIIGAAALLTAGTATVVIKNIHSSGEPQYQGRPLLSWLGDFESLREPSFSPETQKDKVDKAREAIRQMGTNALPFLLADLCSERFKSAHYSQPDKRTLHARCMDATEAFIVLGAQAKSAIPELVNLMEENPLYISAALAGIGRDALPQLLNFMTNENFWVRDFATVAVVIEINREKISPEEAGAAFPIALSNLDYTCATNEMFQTRTRYDAIQLLGALQMHPEICIPAFIKGLEEAKDKDTTLAVGYVGGLWDFRKYRQAQAAIPILTQAANSTNTVLSGQAKWALDSFNK